MDNAPEVAPLNEGVLTGSQEALVPPVTPSRSSNSRALKIAGLTTLACLLLSSQVFTAYMVFNQKQQIHSLQKSSEKMGRQLTRSSNVVSPMRLHMPMNSLPLISDFVSDEVPKPTKAKTPLTKLQDAVVNVEKQVKELVQQDSQLPQFNKTFLANLHGLKKQMNESEWKSFETWMRYWLIFQMAQQQQPAPPTASTIKTKCQLEASAKSGKLGDFRPQCDEHGKYRPMQCWFSTGFCWCVDDSGATIEGTAVRGRADCEKGPAPRRAMIAPLLVQKTISPDE
ncbi:CD74 molecule, major histocompatibility complex, class II invariant chain a isoform X3 [Cheilinus undulatus]|uniref:CD74 molecule, major histocompatibility complex, class II invariant chain a isoform X3 n=1 Tax=Cheilinus undulatus TaxID=241271 RepID=UPI001BD3F324|nr:CD74 molecule, major histocompatibility complex, class II invariant chain a isoform X3 [Cheilinus undulatus]